MDRKTKLELKQKVYVTDETHNILREQKRKQEKSMARIVNDLIMEKYGKPYGKPY